MSQFMAYANANQNTKDMYPLLIDIQTDLIREIKTRVVIPLVLKEKHFSLPISNLNPVIMINRKEYLLLTQQIAGISTSQLGKEIVDLSKYRKLIIDAIDFVITGI